jgi:two-component system, LytTR family, sensor kinase
MLCSTMFLQWRSWSRSGCGLTNQIDIAIFGPELIKEHMKMVMPGKAGLGALIYVLIAVMYYTFIYAGRLQDKMKEEARLKELVTQTQLNELKSQINPHFLFNSLNSVSYLTIAEPEKAQEMVIKLSSFLRYSLKHKQNPASNTIARDRAHKALPRD